VYLQRRIQNFRMGGRGPDGPVAFGMFNSIDQVDHCLNAKSFLQRHVLNMDHFSILSIDYVRQYIGLPVVLLVVYYRSRIYATCVLIRGVNPLSAMSQ